MKSLLLTVSGSGGGSSGPQEIYPHLNRFLEKDSVDVVSIETTKNDPNATLEKVCHTAKNNFENYEDIYIMGYSMGGGVAALAAKRIIETISDKVRGVFLLSSQTDGLGSLFDLNIKVLFYYGEQEEYFPKWQVESIFKRCTGAKKFIQKSGLNHSLGQNIKSFKKSRSYSLLLAEDVARTFSEFFLKSTSNDSGNEVLEHNLRHKNSLEKFYLALGRALPL